MQCIKSKNAEKRYMKSNTKILLAFLIVISAFMISINKVNALTFHKYTGSIDNINNGSMQDDIFMICHTDSSNSVKCINSTMVSNAYLGYNTYYSNDNSSSTSDNYIFDVDPNVDKNSMLKFEYIDDNHFYIKNLSNNLYFYANNYSALKLSSNKNKFKITNVDNIKKDYLIGNQTRLEGSDSHYQGYYYISFRYVDGYFEMDSTDTYFNWDPMSISIFYAINKSLDITGSNVCDKDDKDAELINVDYSDYANSTYKYMYSNDNINWIDVTSQLQDYKYETFEYYNTTVYAKILDSNDNVVASNSYTYYNSLLKDQYVITLRKMDNSIIKNYVIKGDQTFKNLYDSSNIHDTIYTQSNYATGLYLDSNKSEIFEFNDACPVKNLDIYVDFYPIYPQFTKSFKYDKETKKLYLILTYSNYTDSNSDWIILINNSNPQYATSFNYAHYQQSNVAEYEVVPGSTFKVSFMLNNEVKEYIMFDIDYYLNNEYQNELAEYKADNIDTSSSSSILNDVKSIFNASSSVISGFTNLIAYAWNSLNWWIKGTILILIANLFCKMLIHKFLGGS